MRVLMLNYEFPPLGGGTGNACYYLLKEFAKHPGIVIDVITSSANNRYEEEQFAPNIKLFKLNVRKKQMYYWRGSEVLWWLWGARWIAKKLVSQNHYGLCHSWTGWPSGIIGNMFHGQIPHLVGLRGIDIPGAAERLALLDKLVFRRLSRKIWGNANVVTAPSSFAAGFARKTLEREFVVVPNGIDINIFTPGQMKPADAVRVLSVGRLNPVKATKNTILALKKVMTERPDLRITFSHVGGGPLQSEMLKLVAELGLEKAVTFMGPQKHEDLPAIYRNHDIFILSSLFEASPNVVVEALASGLAIITTRTGGAEFIDGNGYVVEIGDSDAIAEKLGLLAADRDLLARMKARSVELAPQHAWAISAENHLRLYEEITGNAVREYAPVN